MRLDALICSVSLVAQAASAVPLDVLQRRHGVIGTTYGLGIVDENGSVMINSTANRLLGNDYGHGFGRIGTTWPDKVDLGSSDGKGSEEEEQHRDPGRGHHHHSNSTSAAVKQETSAQSSSIANNEQRTFEASQTFTPPASWTSSWNTASTSLSNEHKDKQKKQKHTQRVQKMTTKSLVDVSSSAVTTTTRSITVEIVTMLPAKDSSTSKSSQSTPSEVASNAASMTATTRTGSKSTALFSSSVEAQAKHKGHKEQHRPQTRSISSIASPERSTSDKQTTADPCPSDADVTSTTASHALTTSTTVPARSSREQEPEQNAKTVEQQTSHHTSLASQKTKAKGAEQGEAETSAALCSPSSAVPVTVTKTVFTTISTVTTVGASESGSASAFSGNEDS